MGKSIIDDMNVVNTEQVQNRLGPPPPTQPPWMFKSGQGRGRAIIALAPLSHGHDPAIFETAV